VAAQFGAGVLVELLPPLLEQRVGDLPHFPDAVVHVLGAAFAALVLAVQLVVLRLQLAQLCAGDLGHRQELLERRLELLLGRFLPVAGVLHAIHELLAFGVAEFFGQRDALRRAAGQGGDRQNPQHHAADAGCDHGAPPHGDPIIVQECAIRPAGRSATGAVAGAVRGTPSGVMQRLRAVRKKSCQSEGLLVRYAPLHGAAGAWFSVSRAALPPERYSDAGDGTRD